MSHCSEAAEIKAEQWKEPLVGIGGACHAAHMAVSSEWVFLRRGQVT